MARIVLAEDDATMVHLLGTLLRMEGHEVTTVDGDEDVAAAIRKNSPDALVLDAIFGRQSGLEVVGQIRRGEPERRLYILMMSGLSLRDDCLRCGADDFLMKPFNPDEMVGLLRAHVPGERLNRVEIREFSYPADLEAALRLWDSAGPGVHVGPSDTPAELEKKLQRDPDLFLVAVDGERLVGTVIGAYDGRRGMVYHLAVAEEYRRGGIASRLMAEVEGRLKAKGCIKCYLLVRPDNHGAAEYYKAIGWSLSDNMIFMKEFA